MDLQNIIPKDGPAIKEVQKYIKKYTNEVIVIKCGGSVLSNPESFKIFIQDISVLKKLNFNPCVIHGGGAKITNKLKELNIKSNFINGLRVTDSKIINIVENVLIEFNKEIVNALINSLFSLCKGILSEFLLLCCVAL